MYYLFLFLYTSGNQKQKIKEEEEGGEGAPAISRCNVFFFIGGAFSFGYGVEYFFFLFRQQRATLFPRTVVNIAEEARRNEEGRSDAPQWKKKEELPNEGEGEEEEEKNSRCCRRNDTHFLEGKRQHGERRVAGRWHRMDSGAS